MNEVVILSAVRTPLGKGNKGSLKDVRPDNLGSYVVKELIKRLSVSAESVEDIVIGCAMPEAEQGMNVARIIGLLSGLPYATSAATVNRFCSSGLNAISDVAKSIQLSQINVGVAGGVESMSLVPMGGHRPSANPELMKTYPEAYCSMGITAENVAKKFNISRVDQDKFAHKSHINAINAMDNGSFREEIVPLKIEVFSENGPFEALINEDEGPRRDTSAESLAKLVPVFHKFGSVTAGNSSQLSDGAAALFLSSTNYARAEGLKPIGYFRDFVTCGVPPEIMGVGPIYAVRKLLKKTGVSLGSIGVIELNEAFASQAIHCIRELDLDPDIVNPCGGAIAMGHPLGCTGARQAVTILHEMKRRNARFGICTMCVGGGMGAAGLFELY